MSTVGRAHTIRVLVVGDAIADLSIEALTTSDVATFELAFCNSLWTALGRLNRDRGIDIVLVDLDLPDARGLEAVVRFQPHAEAVPLVVCSSNADETVARAAVNLGAQDFIVKGSQAPDAIARALRYGIDRHASLRELRRTQAQLASSLGETNQALAREHETMARLEEMMQLKDDFVGIVSHDLRSPLTVIGGHARLLLHRADQLDEATRECLETILRKSKDMGALIQDMLDVSAIDSGGLRLEVTEFDLAEMIQRSALELSIGSGRVCRVRADACPLVRGDQRRHDQILSNLVTNAFKFSEATEPVEISVGVIGDMVEVEVRDHGPGIAEGDLPNLFQRYSPMKCATGAAKPSTGLGLFIVKSLVEAQGGTISVASVVGEGTTFRYTAPVAARQVSAGDEQAA